jgi:DNA-binding transcriptional regulator YiaG
MRARAAESTREGIVAAIVDQEIMSDIATALKQEVQRIARKEIRLQTESMRKASALHRREIAALKRQVKALEQTGRALKKAARARPDTADPVEGAGQATSPRWSAKRFQAHRSRLGLSAQAMGRLLGVTGQSIYNWEQMKTTPRPEQLQAIAGLRSLSKRRAQAALAVLEPGES